MEKNGKRKRREITVGRDKLWREMIAGTERQISLEFTGNIWLWSCTLLNPFLFDIRHIFKYKIPFLTFKFIIWKVILLVIRVMMISFFILFIISDRHYVGDGGVSIFPIYLNSRLFRIMVSFTKLNLCFIILIYSCACLWKSHFLMEYIPKWNTWVFRVLYPANACIQY